MNDPNRLFRYERAAEQVETDYAMDWRQDSLSWQDRGLYQLVAKFAEPKPGRFILDAGTGVGQQLIWLTAAEGEGLYIGTERTPINVIAAKSHLESLGMDAVSVLLTKEAALDEAGKVFWKPRLTEELYRMRAQILSVLQRQLLIVDDDMRFPETVPIVLGKEKLDAAILSMPGGSPLRSFEWPYVAEEVAQSESDRRIVEISNDSRQGFYHYAAATVRPEGKMILTERLAAPAQANIMFAVMAHFREKLGEYAKYWMPGRVGSASHSIPQNVELRATQAGQQLGIHELATIGHNVHGVVAEFIRNTVAFTEPARTRPKA